MPNLSSSPSGCQVSLEMTRSDQLICPVYYNKMCTCKIYYAFKKPFMRDKLTFKTQSVLIIFARLHELFFIFSIILLEALHLCVLQCYSYPVLQTHLCPLAWFSNSMM